MPSLRLRAATLRSRLGISLRRFWRLGLQRRRLVVHFESPPLWAPKPPNGILSSSSSSSSSSSPPRLLPKTSLPALLSMTSTTTTFGWMARRRARHRKVVVVKGFVSLYMRCPKLQSVNKSNCFLSKRNFVLGFQKSNLSLKGNKDWTKRYTHTHT